GSKVGKAGGGSGASGKLAKAADDELVAAAGGTRASSPAAAPRPQVQGRIDPWRMDDDGDNDGGSGGVRRGS
ncbi:MAG: hypothetical protein AAFU61_18315, partial [Pseudomonadota bacterium]